MAEIDRRAVLGAALAAAGTVGIASGGVEARAAESGAPPSFPDCTAGIPQIRKVVATNNANGKSYIFTNELVKMDGEIWRTSMEQPMGTPGTGEAAAWLPSTVPSIDPSPDGSRFLFVSIPPSTYPDSVFQDARRSGAPKSGFHRTETYDYVQVMSGEIRLVLDEGDVDLRAGDIVVQRNTRHAWRNLGKVPATLMSVMIRPAGK